MTMTREESFTLKEARERALITAYYEYKCRTQNNCYEVTLENEQWYPYDATITTTGIPQFVVEVKVRENYTYEQIEKWGGSFLERTKLIGIIEKQRENGLNVPIIYTNFYKDKVVTYQLPTNLELYKWEVVALQKDDYARNSIDKLVTKLQPQMIVEITNRKQS